MEVLFEIIVVNILTHFFGVNTRYYFFKIIEGISVIPDIINHLSFDVILKHFPNTIPKSVSSKFLFIFGSIFFSMYSPFLQFCSIELS